VILWRLTRGDRVSSLNDSFCRPFLNQLWLKLFDEISSQASKLPTRGLRKRSFWKKIDLFEFRAYHSMRGFSKMLTQQWPWWPLGKKTEDKNRIKSQKIKVHSQSIKNKSPMVEYPTLTWNAPYYVAITKKLRYPHLKPYIEWYTPNSNESDSFQNFFSGGLELIIWKLVTKFRQKISTITGSKIAGKTSHLGTIRGHLGLIKLYPQPGVGPELKVNKYPFATIFTTV